MVTRASSRTDPGTQRGIPTIERDRARRRRAATAAADPLVLLNPPSPMPSRSPRKSASQARLQRETAHDEIYEKIYVAILEHRLDRHRAWERFSLSVRCHFVK